MQKKVQGFKRENIYIYMCDFEKDSQIYGLGVLLIDFFFLVASDSNKIKY